MTAAWSEGSWGTASFGFPVLQEAAPQGRCPVGFREDWDRRGRVGGQGSSRDPPLPPFPPQLCSVLLWILTSLPFLAAL